MSDQQKEISEIHVNVAEIKGTIEKIEALFTVHVQDPSIHHRPPCEEMKSLHTKLWGLAAGVLAMVGAVIWEKVTQ